MDMQCGSSYRGATGVGRIATEQNVLGSRLRARPGRPFPSMYSGSRMPPSPSPVSRAGSRRPPDR